LVKFARAVCKVSS